jgi:hypothetical protein
MAGRAQAPDTAAAELTEEEQVLEAWEVMQLFTEMRELNRRITDKMRRIGTATMAGVATSYEAGLQEKPEDAFDSDEVSRLRMGLSGHYWHTAFDGRDFEEELGQARRSLTDAYPDEPLLEKIRNLLGAEEPTLF